MKRREVLSNTCWKKTEVERIGEHEFSKRRKVAEAVKMRMHGISQVSVAKNSVMRN